MIPFFVAVLGAVSHQIENFIQRILVSIRLEHLQKIMLPRTALLLMVALENCHPSLQIMDSWHPCSITRLSYKYCATLTAAATTIIIATMIVIAITVITELFLLFLKQISPVIWCSSVSLWVMSQQPPVAERYNTFHKMWALPRVADSHALLKMSGRSNLPCQLFAFYEIWLKGTSHN